MESEKLDSQILDLSLEKGPDRNFERHYEVISLLTRLKQNFPDVYRHIMGIAKSFLKER